MMWSIVHERPVEVDCDRCDGKGWVGVDRGGDPDWCPRCGGSGSDFLDLSELTTLAHNLVTAAGYCASFELGRDYQHCIENAMNRHDEASARRDEWHPGCGRSAPT